MTTALNYIYTIFDGLMSFVFNDMKISNNVTIGWILIVCIVFGILLRSLVAVPQRAEVVSHYRNVERKMKVYLRGY